MGRTLRGFDTAFPYLGARGDVTDADVPDPGLVTKEEEYGSYGSMYIDIGDKISNEMFGGDDNEFQFGAHSFDDFGAQDFDDFGDDGSAASTMLEHRYGYNRLTGNVEPGAYQRSYYGTASPPPGFTFGPMGQLVKVKATQPVPQSPEAAARAAKHAMDSRDLYASIAHKAVWDVTGTSWQIGMNVPVNEQPALDNLMKTIAQRYNVFLFKAIPKASSKNVQYVFSMSPRAAPIGARVAGFTIQPLNRPA